MSGDSIGDRLKGYENAVRYHLPRRLPVVLRVDGKAFHTFTRGLDRPFDAEFTGFMDHVATRLCEEIQGAQLAYVQSDEISVLVHNYKKLDTAAWFDNSIQKMASVSAAIASAAMTKDAGREAHFDSRVFVLPEAEVCSYFIWRQQDATRNSIQMLAQSLYSPKEMHGKNTSVLQEMTWQKGKNWNDVPTRWKRGRCVGRHPFELDGATRSEWRVDNEIPVFTQNREYIEQHLATGDEHDQ